MKKFYLFLIFALSHYIIYGQPTFTFDEVTTPVGTEICMDVTVKDFTDILALDLSINWDPLVLDFQQVQNLELPELTVDLFDTNQADQGKLALNGWLNDLELNNGVTLSDGTSIFQVCFTALATCSSSVLEFTDDPVPIFTTRPMVYPFNTGAFLEPGSVTVSLIDSLPSDTTLCYGDFAELNVLAPTATSFEWTSTNGYLEFSCTDCPNPTVTFGSNTPFGESSDTVMITVSNSDDCEETASIELSTVWYIDMFPMEPDRYFCEGDTISFANETILEAAGLATYHWTGPNGFEDTQIYPTLENIQAEDAGTYHVQVTDAYGCGYSLSFEVIPNIQISIEEIIPESCPATQDGSITVDVQGGTGELNFIWSTGQTDPYSIDGLQADAFHLTVQDENDCLNSLENIMVGNGLITSITQDTVICGGEELQLMVEAPNAVSFQWFSVEPLSCTDCPNPIVQQAFLDDVYLVEVTGPDGCMDMAEVNVGVQQYLDFGLLEFSNSPVCVGDSLFFEPNVFNAQSYQWSGPNGFSSGESHPFIANFLPENAGEYTLEIIDEAGCTTGATFDVILTDGPNIFSEIIDPLCFNACDGSAEVFATGSNPPYSMQWSTGDTTSSLTDLCAGEYTVTVSSENCSSTQTYNLESPPALNIDHTEVTANASCLGGGGMITIWISGGTQPYWVDWGEGPVENETVLDDLSAGIYTITVTDVNGCSAISDPVEVTDNPIYSISEDVVICDGEATQLQVEAPGAVAINWMPATGLDDPTSFSPMAAPATTTTYTAMVEDFDGCMGLASVTVFVGDDACIVITYDTIAVGETGQWCDPTLGPLGLEVTEVTCGPEGFVDFAISDPANCYTYEGISAGQDSVCMTICVTGTDDCFEALLLVVVEDDPVWPGDTDSDGFANHFDLLNIGLGYDSVGPVRPDATLDWIGQSALVWPQYTPVSEVNYKHIDANGDGGINAQDTSAIVLNWGSEHDFNSEEAVERNALVPFYVKPDTLIEGAEMNLPIILGEADVPAEDIYGLAFSLIYEPDVVVPGSTQVNFGESWLGNLGEDVIAIQKDFHSEGRIDVGITRIDGVNISGSGTIGHLHITIEDDILLLQLPNGFVSNDQGVQFMIENVRLIDFNEQMISVSTLPTESEIVTSSRAPVYSRQIRVFPNPAKDQFLVESASLKMEQIELLDVNGRPVQSIRPTKGHTSVSTRALSAGVYFIKIYTPQGVIGKRVVVQ